MSEPNYKLVYQAIPQWEEVLRMWDKVGKAKQDHQKSIENWRNHCSKISGVPIEDLKFADEMCTARGITHHVYHMKNRHNEFGSIENKCIFCGCDDRHDLF